MADTLSQDPEALKALVQALVEGGAMGPANPRYPHKAEVGAGGYGLPYMPPMSEARAPGEMRSGNEFALSDMLADKMGSPLAGVVVDKTAKLGRSVGQTGANLSMMPWAMETGDQLGKALAETDFGPSRASAQEAPSQLQQLMTQRESLNRQRETAVADRDNELRGKGGKAAGRGPNYDAKNAEVDRLTNEMTGLDKMLQPLLEQQSPEHKLKMETERQRVAEEKRIREANTPWRVKNQALANALPNYAMALSAGMPFGIAAMRNARSFFPGSHPGQMRTAIAEAETARRGGDAATAGLREAELANLLAQSPTMKSEIKNAGMAAGAGGALTSEASMFPDQWDAANLPEGPAKDKAKAESRNIVNYLERGLMGTLTGLSGYEAGSWLTPWRGTNSARAKALVDNPYTPKPTTPDPATSRALSKVHPSEFQPRENGKFNGPPEYPPGHPKHGQKD